MLIGTTPDLVFLSMRLPADLFELRAAIISDLERDASQ
jgi:hypothetical protein